MRYLHPSEPLQLAGFNNLTKSLRFNLYDFCVARNESERHAYFDYVASCFNSDRITDILKGIIAIIEANVLTVSRQNYDPWGASSMILMSDMKHDPIELPNQSTSMHLDKSHICAHTYPDFVKNGLICSLRIDIDISTCGEISPLKALNYMFKAFYSDVVVIDYTVRGFTRDTNGKHVYMDHALKSIKDFVDPKVLKDYFCLDLALQSDNIWQTKMLRTNLDERSYFLSPVDLGAVVTRSMLDMIKDEMCRVLHMRPN